MTITIPLPSFLRSMLSIFPKSSLFSVSWTMFSYSTRCWKRPKFRNTFETPASLAWAGTLNLVYWYLYLMPLSCWRYLLLQLLIYAHGSLAGAMEPRPPLDASESRQEPYFRQAESFFSAAQRRLGLLLCRSGVLEAQCFFLSGVYLMTTIRPLEAWKMFVQALACCQSFYSGKSIPNAANDSDRRLKKSIYWTCFKSEL